MLPLIKNEEKKYEKQVLCQICKDKFNGMFNEDENYCRVCDHCHYLTNTEVRRSASLI